MSSEPGNSRPHGADDSNSTAELLRQYAASHQHPVNRWCHLFGIPAIVLSLPAVLVACFLPGWWPVASALFAGGWILQFVGHAVERKPPEFFLNWRFLLIGFRWWRSKVFSRKG